MLRKIVESVLNESSVSCVNCGYKIWEKGQGYSTLDKKKMKKIEKGICPKCNKPYRE